MGTYSLNWPGFGDFPIYVIDKENGNIYCEKDPLPYERRNLNHFGHHHVLLDDVMELFSSMTMVKASIKLVLLTDNVTMYPIYKDEKTKKRYLSLDTLLAFVIVFPFCPEFQRARAAVLRFLTLYPDLTCSSCGFIQRDCRCVRIGKKPLSKFHPSDDGMPEELVAKVSDLKESSAQTDKKICPICEDTEAFNASTSPWLVMPPGMKVRPGDKLPLPVLNNAKIINCATVSDLDSSVSTNANFHDGVAMPNQASPVNVSSMPGMPMQMITQSQMAGLPLSMLPYNLSNDGPYFSSQSLLPQSSISPMVNIGQQFSPIPGSPYLQPINLRGSFLNQGFGGPPAPSNMSPLAPINNNGKSVPGSMGPPLAPPRNILKMPQLSPIQNMHQLSAQFKPSKIKTMLAKRKPGQEEVKRGRPPKKPKISSDFKMIGPARRIVNVAEEKTSESKTDTDDIPRENSPAKKTDEELEPGEIPKDVLEEIKESVVIEFMDGSPKKNGASPAGSGEKSTPEKDKDAVETSENGDDKNKKTANEKLPDDKEKESSACAEESEDDKNGAVSDGKSVDSENKADDKDSESKEVANVADGNEKLSEEEKDSKESSPEPSGTDDSTNSSCSTPTAEIDNDKNNSKEENTAEEEKDKNGSDGKDGDPSVDQQIKEKPLKIQSVSGVCVPAEKCKDSPYYMVSPNGNITQHERGFAEFEFGPTGENMLRCILYGCGQCFDTYELAELHEKTHCARGQGLECPHCDTFKVVNARWYHLLRHMEEAHDVKLSKSEFQCYLCGLDLENEEMFQEHQTFHHYSHYKCIHCGITLFTWSHVKHHLKECADKEKGHFYHNCPYCHIVFHGPAFQEVHVKSHKDQGLVCCYCKEEKVWDSWKHLKKHYEIFHLAKEHKRLHKCMHCKMHFSSLKKFKVHLQTRHNPDKPEEPKVAPKRKRKSSQVEDGKESEKAVEEKTVKKEVVGKKSGRIRKKKSIDKSEWVGGDEVLTEEEEEEEEEQAEQTEGSDVEQNDKQDTSVSDKDEAEKDAEKEKQEAEKKEEEKEKEKEVIMLDCPECDKKFRTKKRLDMHVERNHGEEVQCTKCDYVARNAFYMKAHDLQKHGEKEHQCSDCGKPFGHYFELKIHLAKHARNTVFTCKVCWQECDSRADLRKHKETAHAVEPPPSRPKTKEKEDLNCSLCEFVATNSAQLTVHQVAEHPEDGADHAYFNKASTSAPKVKVPSSSKPVRSAAGRGRGKKVLKGGKGRGRGKVGARGGPATVGGSTGRRGRKDKVKERKMKEKLVREKMIRKLKRSTCARTRSIDEHRAIKSQENEENVTIDESSKPHSSSRPSPSKGRWAKKYQHAVPLPRPTSSLWSDFEITPLEPTSEDLLLARSVELDHSYYHSTSLDILNIRNQLRDTRVSVSEDDAWAPEPMEYEECLTSPTGQRSKGKQQSPSQLKTVLKDGPGQLQGLRGSHRVELQPLATVVEPAEDPDMSSNGQNDSLGDLENLIQGDMSDIMLAAEQYLQESSLMNDSLEGIGSPSTSNDFFLQDSETVASNIDSQVSLQSSPVKGAVPIQSFKTSQSPRKISELPKRKVVVQTANVANTQVFTLSKMITDDSQADEENSNLLNSSAYPDNEEANHDESHNNSVADDGLSDGLSLSSQLTNVTSTMSNTQLDYMQTPSVVGSLPDDILQSPEYSTPANDSQVNSSTVSSDLEDNVQYHTPFPRTVAVSSASVTPSRVITLAKPSDGRTPVGQPKKTLSSPSTPTKTYVKTAVSSPVQFSQPQPGASKTVFLPMKRTVVPQTNAISPGNDAKKTVVIQSTSGGKRTVMLPPATDGKEQKILLRSPGTVGNIRSVFQDGQGLAGVAPGSKVKVIRVIQTPGSNKTSLSTSPGQTQRILIPKNTTFTRTVQRPSTSNASASNVFVNKPASELEEAVRSISDEKSLVDELNDTLFANITDGAE